MKTQAKQGKCGKSRLAKGFSLFEMVIVMGIIGLILGGAIYTMGGIFGGAEVSQADQDMNTLMTGLESYKRNGGSYPTNDQGLEALYEKPTSAPRPRRWVQLVKKEEGLFDPWDTKYKYQFPGSKDPNIPEIISAGPDRKFGTEDDQSTQDE